MTIKINTRCVLHNRRLIITLWILLLPLLGYGAANLSLTNNFRIYFGDSNPQLKAFEQLEETFGTQDILQIFLGENKGDIFNKQTLTLLHLITEKAYNIPYVERVNSLANYQHTQNIDGELYTDYLIKDPNELTRESISSIRNIALNEKTLVNAIVAENGKATGILVRIDTSANGKQARREAVNYTREFIRELRLRFPDVSILLAGNAASGVTLGEAVKQDLTSLVVLSYLLIFSGLMFLLRSVTATLLTLLLVTSSVISTFGIFGWQNVVLSPISGWVPTIIMTIGVASIVHVVIAYLHELDNGKDKNEAILSALNANILPIIVTSITTIIGMLSLNFSDSPPYQNLGNMVATGTAFTCVFSLIVLPALLSIFSIKPVNGRKLMFTGLEKLGRWVTRYHKLIFISIVLTMPFFFTAIGKNAISEKWTNYFDETFEINEAVQAIDSRLSGIHQIKYVLKTTTNGVYNPNYLQQLEEFGHWYRQQPGVAHVYALSDVIKRLNEVMHDDDTAFHIIPDDQKLAAQLFLLYELGLPPEQDLSNLVNHERSQSVLSVIVKGTGSQELIDLDNAASMWLKQNAKNIEVSDGTGLDMMFAHINNRNIYGLLEGVILAIVLITLILCIVFRSIKIGVMSIIPNLVPAGVAYGIWGIFVGNVDLSASVVICMSLGIVVDDTVHFLYKYSYARKALVLSPTEAVHYTFKTVGVALSVTTFSLVIGFLILSLSHFSPTQTTGTLMALTLFIALVIDLLLLPSILMKMDKKKIALFGHPKSLLPAYSLVGIKQNGGK